MVFFFSFATADFAPQLDGKRVVAVPEAAKPSLFWKPRGIFFAQTNSDAAHNLGQLVAINSHTSYLAADERLDELGLDIQGYC